MLHSTKLILVAMHDVINQLGLFTGSSEHG